MKKNPREAKVINEYESNGWEVIVKGWPDLLCYKNGKIKMVEVKRSQKRITLKGGLSKHQLRMKEILKSIGIDVEIRYVD